MPLISEEKREDSLYRVVRCCGNCYFSSYYRGRQRRLVCIHGIVPDPRGWGRPPASKKVEYEKFYKKNMYDRFPATHATAVCDYHKWTKKAAMTKVADWCRAEVMGEFDD